MDGLWAMDQSASHCEDQTGGGGGGVVTSTRSLENRESTISFIVYNDNDNEIILFGHKKNSKI